LLHRNGINWKLLDRKAEPESGFGEGELKFAAVFTEEEGHVSAAKKAEVRRKKFANGRKGVLEPLVLGSELLGPCVRGGKKKEASSADESGQDLPQEFFRVLHPIDQVGGED